MTFSIIFQLYRGSQFYWWRNPDCTGSCKSYNGPFSAYEGQSWPCSYGSWIYNYLSPLMLWLRILIRVRCTTLCDKVCQWLATGRWFSANNLKNHRKLWLLQYLYIPDSFYIICFYNHIYIHWPQICPLRVIT